MRGHVAEMKIKAFDLGGACRACLRAEWLGDRQRGSPGAGGRPRSGGMVVDEVTPRGA